MTDRQTFDSAQWDLIADAFERAIELHGEERAAFVRSVFVDDHVARRELEGVLEEHEKGQPLSIEEWMVTDGAEAAIELDAGTRIGSYRIAATIGRGGMGEVYRGERVDGTYEQDVAIKVLRAGLGSRELVKRFQTERRILARLQHPSIVRILDGGTTADGRPYLVMPFVEGLPLTAHCDAHVPTLDGRLQLFMRVAAAVQYAHAHLVVHRDIKPSNILVSPTGDVHLLDFGIAKLLAGPDEHTESETRSALRLLTPEHASPEQVRGEVASTATDIYALGVLLYELLTDTRPHRLGQRSMPELERDILEREPAAPSTQASPFTWARRVRGDLDRIVLMALRKEPARRYGSVGQLVDDLERFLKGLPVAAERDRFGYRFEKFVRRNRGGVAVAAVVALLMVVLSVSMTWQARQLARERDRVQGEKATTESVVALLTSLFARANPVLVPGGDTLRVEQLLAAGETLVDSLSGTPYVQARMWRVLGTMHQARGRLDVAEVTLRRAYDRMMAMNGSDSLEVAQTYHELARAVESHEGRAKALPMFAASFERLRRSPGVRPQDLMVAERELAERSNDQAASRKALQQLVAAKVMKSAADSMEQAASLNALASSRYGAGQMRDARTLFGESLRLLEALLPVAHPNRLVVEGNLAMALRDLGEFALAEGMARKMVDLQRTQVTDNPIAMAGAMERLASTQALRGFLDDAERGYRQAGTLENSVLAPTHSMILMNMGSLSYLTSARGRSREALLVSDSALRIARAGGASETDSLWLHDLRAGIHIELERWDDAQRALKQTDAPIRRLAPFPHWLLDTHGTALGMLSLGQARYDNAATHFTAAASGRRARTSPLHPEIAGDDCGRGIALAKLDRRVEAAPLLADACARYKTLGTYSRLLVRWAEETR